VKCFGGEQAVETPDLRNRIFLLASISKAITGTAVARLVDQGLVKWEEPLSKYLPEMKDGSDNEKIRVGDVFLHRTGYFDIAKMIDPSVIPTCEAYKELLRQGPGIKPGSFFRYASTTYWFINALVHKLLGFESMQDFLAEWLFEPCGMKNTAFLPPEEKTIDPHHLTGKEMDHFMGAEIPGAGLWSTMDDLLNLGRAVIEPGKLFSEETFTAMTEAHPMKKAGDDGFSCRTYGWVKELKFNNQPLRGFYHGGATGGVLWCDKECDLIVVFMSNQWGGGNDDAFNVISSFYNY
jgi:CubicO group peptidase (beta-lactamase class C family)